MGALKVWTGTQWTEAGGGLRDVPAGVQGVEIYNASTQSLSASWTQMEFDTTATDTDGFADLSNNQIVIPAGMSGYYYLRGQIQHQTSSNAKYNRFYINGVAYGVSIVENAQALNGWMPHPSEEPIIYLNAGDTVQLWGYAATTKATQADGVRLAVVRLGSGIVSDSIGAHGYHSATQTVASTTITPVDIDTIEYDSDGFWSSGANDRYTIPAGLGGRYLLVGSSKWNGGTATEMFWRKNGAATYLSTSGLSADGYSVCAVDLDAGDYVELCAYQTGTSTTIGSATTGTAQSRSSITLLATTGAAPGRVRTGTAFPTPGAAWTDRFVRTDLDGLEFTHDGTRWVTTQMFHSNMTDDDSNSATSTQYVLTAAGLANGLAIYLVDAVFSAYVAATNDGSNYWNARIRALDNVTVDATVNISSAAMGTAQYAKATATIDTALDTGVDVLDVVFEKNGSPTPLTIYGVGINYRLIAT